MKTIISLLKRIVIEINDMWIIQLSDHNLVIEPFQINRLDGINNTSQLYSVLDILSMIIN